MHIGLDRLIAVLQCEGERLGALVRDLDVELNLGDLLQQLSTDRTIVLVSHDLGFVSGFVKTVICVHRHVDIHPTSELDGRTISDIYGGDVRMVRHNHRIDQ